jgi:carbonic anhydrase
MNKKNFLGGPLRLAACCLLLAGTAFASGAYDGPGADEALKKLFEGNTRFVKGAMLHPHSDAGRRNELASGQKPFAAVLTCSDSRVAPEVLFDQGLGDIFVIRVAGNIAGPSEQGSIEYAVEHLNVPLLVVLGHTKCGAVKAACGGGHAGGAVAGILKTIEPAIKSAKARGAGGEGLAPAVEEENVRLTAVNLLRKNAVVREFAKQGKVKVVGALYDIATGEVRLVDYARIMKDEEKARVASVKKMLGKLRDGSMGDQERSALIGALGELMPELKLPPAKAASSSLEYTPPGGSGH